MVTIILCYGYMENLKSLWDNYLMQNIDGKEQIQVSQNLAVLWSFH